MEKRQKLTLAERKKWQSPLPRSRNNQQLTQEKPSVGKKGARGQSEGMASKAPGKGIVGTKSGRKKPGRAKQMAGGEKQAAKHKKPRAAKK